jgi:hypothetical protein
MATVDCYLLNEINVMQSTALELSPASRKYQVLPRDIHLVLVPLELHQLSLGDIVVPYLHQTKPQGSKQTVSVCT